MTELIESVIKFFIMVFPVTLVIVLNKYNPVITYVDSQPSKIVNLRSWFSEREQSPFYLVFSWPKRAWIGYSTVGRLLLSNY